MDYISNILQVYLEKYTTKSGLEPSEVHQIGLTEVDESKKKLTKIAENLGYKNLPFREFIQKIREDPKQSFSRLTCKKSFNYN